MQSDVKNSSATTSEASPAAPSTVANETMREALMGRLRRGDIGQLPAVLMLLVIVVVFEILSGGVFLHPINLSNLILQEADVAVIALAAVLTLLLAEIDLSLAAVAYLCGAVTVITSRNGKYPSFFTSTVRVPFGNVIENCGPCVPSLTIVPTDRPLMKTLAPSASSSPMTTRVNSRC